MSEFTTLMARDGHEFSAWLAAPAGKPRGAVLVIQEIFGVNAHIRAVADSYAAEGYVAIAPALFDRVRRGIVLGYTPDTMKEGIGYVQQLAARKNAAGSGGLRRGGQTCFGRVGVVGFCWGGKLAYLSACELPIACGVAYYGGGIAKELARTPKCPMLYHFGGKDTHIPESDIAQIRAADPRGTLLYLSGSRSRLQLRHARQLQCPGGRRSGPASARSPSSRSTCAAQPHRPTPRDRTGLGILRYISSPDFRQDAERIGILLVNTGTPESLELRDIRRYLDKFLSDPRVIELPQWLWQPLLHGYLLRTRYRAARRPSTARSGRRTGAPLLSLSQRTAHRSWRAPLGQRALAPFSVELGMLYSTPSVADEPR